jgi:hypothetical protein
MYIYIYIYIYTHTSNDRMRSHLAVGFNIGPSSTISVEGTLDFGNRRLLGRRCLVTLLPQQQ